MKRIIPAIALILAGVAFGAETTTKPATTKPAGTQVGASQPAAASQPAKIAGLFKTVDREWMPVKGKWAPPQLRAADAELQKHVGERVVVTFPIGNLKGTWIDSKVADTKRKDHKSPAPLVNVQGVELVQLVTANFKDHVQLLKVKDGETVTVEGAITSISIGNFSITDGHAAISFKLSDCIIKK